MKMRLALAALVLGSSTLAAQGQGHDHDQAVAQGRAAAPAGWTQRFDRANADRNAVRFETMGNGLHVTGGPAAIYWNATNTAQGTYAVEATFTQMRAPQHAEAYGLFWGGRNLTADNQDYLYFVIRKDGKYLVKHRAGAETHTIADWTEHPAIVKEGADGKQTNTLRIEVTATATRLLANGQLVRELPRQGMAANTDGIAGLRINHNLDVHIDGFGIRR